jgi:hypothetical protein
MGATHRPDRLALDLDCLNGYLRFFNDPGVIMSASPHLTTGHRRRTQPTATERCSLPLLAVYWDLSAASERRR